MVRLRLLGGFLQSCVLPVRHSPPGDAGSLAVLGLSFVAHRAMKGLRPSLARWQFSPLHEDRFGFGEGDAAVAAVELEEGPRRPKWRRTLVAARCAWGPAESACSRSHRRRPPPRRPRPNQARVPTPTPAGARSPCPYKDPASRARRGAHNARRRGPRSPRRRERSLSRLKLASGGQLGGKAGGMQRTQYGLFALSTRSPAAARRSSLRGARWWQLLLRRIVAQRKWHARILTL